MKKTLFVAAGVVLVGSAFAQTTNFSGGHLVVSAVGLTISGSGAAGPVSLKEFDLTPSSAPVSVVNFDPSGPNRFVYPWNTNSGLNLQFNAGFFTISGYDADSGTLGVSSSSASAVSRLVAKIPVAGSITRIVNTTMYNAGTPRSVVTDGTDFWNAGTGTGIAVTGIQYMQPSGTALTITQTPNVTNTRVASIFGGNLYYSTQSTTGGQSIGVHKYTGTPVAPATATLVAAGQGTSPSPYDFVFTDANTLYVADDRTIANGGGVQKYTFDGTNWNFAYAINTGMPVGCRAITFLGTNGGFAEFAVITNETVNTTTVVATVPSAIYKVTDGGSNALSTSVLLQTAPNNQNYRGVRYIPAPASQVLSGTLNLGDTGGAFAFNRSIGYTVKQGTSTIGSGTVVASASASSFSISLPASATGAATIEWDGSSFLLRKTNVNLTGSNAAIGSVTMQNGDVDNSTEVDAVDIDLVIASFGLTTDINEDVDVSGEVDAVDIDIVIANFGGVND